MKDIKTKNKKWPNEKRRRAVDRGADELMNLVEWQLGDRPIALRNCRTSYENICWQLHQRLVRARRGR